jgi:hypothetical protein
MSAYFAKARVFLGYLKLIFATRSAMIVWQTCRRRSSARQESRCRRQSNARQVQRTLLERLLVPGGECAVVISVPMPFGAPIKQATEPLDAVAADCTNNCGDSKQIKRCAAM